MNAMILAAGLGTRLRPYTEYRPKPLFPVLGKPLILHLVEQLRGHGFQTIAINTHFHSAQFGDILKGERDLVLQREEDILGTGGGLRRVSSRLGQEPFLVVNGDILHSLDLGEIYRRHLASGALVSMVVHDQVRFNNIRVSAQGTVSALRIGKEKTTPAFGERPLAFAGIHVIDPSVLAGIPATGCHDIIDLYRKMIASGGVINAIEVSGHFWTDIGTPQDYLALHRRLLTEPSLAEALGFRGLTTAPVVFGEEVVLGEEVAFREWAFVGSRATIGAGARIARSVLWDGAVVAAGARIEDGIVV